MASADTIHGQAQELSQGQDNPTEGLSIPTPAFSEDDLKAKYPDQSPNWNEQNAGNLPPNHGFPSNPMELLGAHLDRLEKHEEEEERKWARVGRTAKELEELDDKKVEVLVEEDMEGNISMSYDELVKPLDSDQIMQARAASKAKKGGKVPKYRVEPRVFIFGGHDKLDDQGKPYYDDQKDREAYRKLVESALNSDGRSMLGEKKIEGVQGTSKFKLYVEVLHLVE